tara:strand:- start:169 stop:555 length:387 start_codon:yes stop_codon:yes gene_type:complete
MKIDVSVGEVVDKITILEIKNKKITDDRKLQFIGEELNLLKNTLKSEGVEVPSNLVDELREINLKLWEAEDIIRECEINNDFGASFVECARNDAILNDQRFLVKNKINNHCESKIKEQKSYEGLYNPD